MKDPKVPFYRKDGITVVDATEPLTLKVTQGDVDRAVMQDNRACALAQCALRYGRTASRKQDILNVSVGNKIVLILRSDGLWHRYFIHPEDRKMIDVFDTMRFFRLGNYVLLPATESTRIGARRGEAPGSNTRTGRARRVTQTPSAVPTRQRPAAALTP